jgi:hypothetical protein
VLQGSGARAADLERVRAEEQGPVDTGAERQATDSAPSGDTVAGDGVEPAPYAPVFKTSYEPSEAFGRPADAHEWIRLENLAEGPGALERPAGHSLFYEAGTVSDRYARVVDDPTAPGNSVLHYWLRNAVIPTNYLDHTKGRIQSGVQLEPQAPVTELYSKQRIYLHPDLGLLLEYPPSGDRWWLGISIHDLWIGASWLGHPNHAILSLWLAPDFAAGVYRLTVVCSTVTTFETFWQRTAAAYAVPLGEWLTVEVGYRMGNAETGRFVVKLQVDGASEPTLIDVTDWTYSPHADEPGGTGPVPVTHWNPQKLYASDNVLHFIRDRGGVAQILWDDFEYAWRWPPAWP